MWRIKTSFKVNKNIKINIQNFKYKYILLSND